MEWTRIHGKLVQGYRVASGPSTDYPYGALDRQRPIFASRGLDLSNYFNGTLNIDISPRTFTMAKPEFTFEHVAWTDLHPPEHFSFSLCKVIYNEVEYDGWVYYPHPETKLRNFQNPSLLEVIALPIPEINYGAEVDVLVNSEEIIVDKPLEELVNHLEEEGRVKRNRLLPVLAILAVIIILIVGGFGIPWSRSKSNPPQSGKRTLVSELAYCSSNDIQPCIMSFTSDTNGKMQVNIVIPDSSYPDFYLMISNDDEKNRYECQTLEDSPTNVYCTGKDMNPGEILHFAIVSSVDERVLAEGNFAIIGLMLATPEVEATETALPTETPEPTESPTPFLLDILTPIPTSITPSYPNPSYP